jgi:LysM repeat protein
VPTATPAATPSPTPEPTASPTPTDSVYTVVDGDTCYDIALAHDVALEDLLAANGLTEDDCSFLQPGDELLIP